MIVIEVIYAKGTMLGATWNWRKNSDWDNSRRHPFRSLAVVAQAVRSGKKRGAIFCLQQFFNLVYFGLVQINLPAKSNDFGHEFVTCNDFGDGYNE